MNHGCLGKISRLQRVLNCADDRSTLLSVSLIVAVACWSDVCQRSAAGELIAQPTWVLAAELFPAQDIFDDEYGRSVAISGTTIAVGAPHDVQALYQSGSVYVFESQSQDEWAYVAKLRPIAGEMFQSYGRAIDVSGDTIAVGAVEAAFPSPARGIVFVHQKNDDGEWVETTRLRPAEEVATNVFGFSVALCDDVLAVGSYFEEEMGAVYIYERDVREAWVETDRLVPPDGHVNQSFGRSVSVHAGRLVVGAPGDNVNGDKSGAAYIYERSDTGSWELAAKVHSSQPVPDDRFGWSTSLHETSALVASLGPPPSNFGPRQGSARVFVRNASGVWLEEASLTPHTADDMNGFGAAAAIAHDEAVISSFRFPGFDGKAHFYSRVSGGVWVHRSTHVLNSDLIYDGFGSSLAMDGGLAVVGEQYTQNPKSGGVYVYRLNLTAVGDLNNDFKIDGTDLALMFARWGVCSLPGGEPCDEDLNGDGIVNGIDLAHLLANWRDD